jgi:hypothetical protein
MAGWRRAAAREERGWVGFYRCSPSGDITVTREMLVVARALGQRTYGGVQCMGRRVPRVAVALDGAGADAEANRCTAVARGRVRRRSGFKRFVGALFE